MAVRKQRTETSGPDKGSVGRSGSYVPFSQTPAATTKAAKAKANAADEAAYLTRMMKAKEAEGKKTLQSKLGNNRFNTPNAASNAIPDSLIWNDDAGSKKPTKAKKNAVGKMLAKFKGRGGRIGGIMGGGMPGEQIR